MCAQQKLTIIDIKIGAPTISNFISKSFMAQGTFAKKCDYTVDVIVEMFTSGKHKTDEHMMHETSVR